MRNITINNQTFEIPIEITSFAAGVDALEASAKALPDKPTPEQVAESKRALEVIKAFRAEAKAKAKAEIEVPTTTEGAK